MDLPIVLLDLFGTRIALTLRAPDGLDPKVCRCYAPVRKKLHPMDGADRHPEVDFPHRKFFQEASDWPSNMRGPLPEAALVTTGPTISRHSRKVVKRVLANCSLCA